MFPTSTHNPLTVYSKNSRQSNFSKFKYNHVTLLWKLQWLSTHSVQNPESSQWPSSPCHSMLMYILLSSLVFFTCRQALRPTWPLECCSPASKSLSQCIYIVPHLTSFKPKSNDAFPVKSTRVTLLIMSSYCPIMELLIPLPYLTKVFHCAYRFLLLPKSRVFPIW